ncbi:signal transduction ATPase, FimS family [gamma proteobacterium NOR5-3]|nr:signal transduction ATPase, FimS family [gamma proteobacterium NOR5-3]
MNQRVQSVFSKYFSEERIARFWVFQLAGWTGLSIVSYFSLNLWYDQPEAAYIGHNILQSVLGVLVSWPLRYVYRRIWNDSLVLRSIYISAAVVIFAGVWSILRLAFFQWMTSETGLWSDFGGWFFPSIFIFMCWTALYHGFKYYRLAGDEHDALLRMESARNVEAARAARAESSAREAQLEMLRYQLNPHFLFNSMNAIQSLVATGRNERASQMITALSDFLRYSLYSDSTPFVSVKDELAALNLYLLIEQARFGERLTVQMNATDEAQDELLPSMLLQPLVENAIKYAIAKSEKGGTLMIEAYCDATHLNVDVTDSGAEISARGAVGEPGVGLSNIRQRLEACYSRDYDFDLHRTAEGGVRAAVRIPRGFSEAVR